MRISDWSSDVCSSDLTPQGNTISPQLFNRVNLTDFPFGAPPSRHLAGKKRVEHEMIFGGRATAIMLFISCLIMGGTAAQASQYLQCVTYARSEEHTSELQSLMRISYAVFCLKKNKQHTYKLH